MGRNVSIAIFGAPFSSLSIWPSLSIFSKSSRFITLPLATFLFLILLTHTSQTACGVIFLRYIPTPQKSAESVDSAPHPLSPANAFASQAPPTPTYSPRLLAESQYPLSFADASAVAAGPIPPHTPSPSQNLDDSSYAQNPHHYSAISVPSYPYPTSPQFSTPDISPAATHIA